MPSEREKSLARSTRMAAGFAALRQNRIVRLNAPAICADRPTHHAATAASNLSVKCQRPALPIPGGERHAAFER
jgi:hypothetical protein